MLPRPLRWDLVAAWAAVGVTSGVVVSDVLTRPALLLVPAALVAAGLLWHFDPSREIGAGLLGLSLGPLLLARQALNPSCPVAGDFPSCEPGPTWPWLAGAVVLLLTGAVVLLAPWRRTPSSSSTTRVHGTRR